MRLIDEYIDRHFFDDFAAYYSMCFHSYPRLGTRLHFFAEAYDKNAAEAFRSSLNGPVEKMDGLTNVFGEYIGFLVIRPLPQTMIGRTCIKAPQVLAEHVFIHRKYDAHLYGYKLRVKSLAFQEQDRTVSACATSALWTCFHKTKKVFGRRPISPGFEQEHLVPGRFHVDEIGQDGHNCGHGNKILSCLVIKVLESILPFFESPFSVIVKYLVTLQSFCRGYLAHKKYLVSHPPCRRSGY